MIKHLKRNFIQRQVFKRMETNILIFKTVLKSQRIFKHPIITRYLLKELYLLFTHLGSASQIRSVCIFTGRTRGVYKKGFNLTRMQVKEKASAGLISGIRKSSW